MLKIFAVFLLIILYNIYDVKLVLANKTKNLFLECSCLHAQDHNGTSTSPSTVALNASIVRHAKNDCYVVFITGSNDEIVSARFKNLQLRPKFGYFGTDNIVPKVIHDCTVECILNSRLLCN